MKKFKVNIGFDTFTTNKGLVKKSVIVHGDSAKEVRKDFESRDICVVSVRSMG